MNFSEYKFFNESSHPLLSFSTTVNLIQEIPLLVSDYTQEGIRMSYVGSHSAFKVRNSYMQNGVDNSNGSKSSSSFMAAAPTSASHESGSGNPSKYSEKMMMSIWGLYNKYSVHNIKSHNPYGGN